MIHRSKKYLELETKKWNDSVDSSINLYAMISLFFAFGQSNEKQYSRSYTANDRYMLKCIFRNLKNGEGQFTNFQILCGIEAAIPTYYYKQQGIASIDLDKDEVIAPLSLMSQIRKTQVKSFKDHTKHVNQLTQLHEKLGPTIDKPSKFFLEKISDVGIRSKVITICVSGFTSDDVAKSEQWKTILETYPYTEIFALNWNSNTMKNLYSHLLKEVPSIIAANQGSVFGLAIPQLRPILLGMATFKIFRGLKEEVWGITYKEAITSGIYLAHILANTDLFKDHVVNLVGFSLGTLIIMNCIWELERLNRKDIIYDVFLMGGVVNASDFNQSTLDVVANKVINCHCESDYILKFLLKMVNYSTNPIGLGPILLGDKRVQNIDVSAHADGHTKYRDNLDKIIPRVDFNEDLHSLL